MSSQGSTICDIAIGTVLSLVIKRKAISSCVPFWHFIWYQHRKCWVIFHANFHVYWRWQVLCRECSSKWCKTQYVITLLYRASLSLRAFNGEFILAAMLGCKKYSAKPGRCHVKIMANPTCLTCLPPQPKTITPVQNTNITFIYFIFIKTYNYKSQNVQALPAFFSLQFDCLTT